MHVDIFMAWRSDFKSLWREHVTPSLVTVKETIIKEGYEAEEPGERERVESEVASSKDS